MRPAAKYALWTAAGIGGVVAGGALLGGVAAVAVAGFTLKTLVGKPVPAGAVVVITGGSRGLGLALASRFARRHVKLVLAARDRAELEEAQQTLLERHPFLRTEDFYLVTADLTQRAECERLIGEAIARFGRIDVLVNNAGVMHVGPIEAQSIDTFEEAIKVMYLAGLYTTWAALPHMRVQEPLKGWRNRAAIVNIASIGGKIAVPHMLPYSAAKFAMVGFSEGLHGELRHKGIHVLTACPGLMRTGGEEQANFVGNAEKEAAWFRAGAKLPIVASSVDHAALRITSALEMGRAEIVITPHAWAAARVASMYPATTQRVAALANHYLLPAV
jgi:short-subunit dehydrogenase